MTIEKRLEVLEWELAREKRRNRLLPAIVGLAVVGLGLAWILTQTTPAAHAAGPDQEIRATAFVLVDEKGKSRARLFVDKAGTTLTLADENGAPRVLLCVGEAGPWLTLIDEKGKPRVSLCAFKDAPRLNLLDEKGKSRAGLALNAEGPVLYLSDENDRHRVWLGLAENQGREDWDGPKLFLYDEKGKRIWAAPK